MGAAEVNASATFQPAGLHEKQKNQWVTVERGKSHSESMWEWRDSTGRYFLQLGKVHKLQREGDVSTEYCEAEQNLPTG